MVAEAKVMHDDGKLDHSVRVLEEAARRCPNSASEAVWPPLVVTLAELGRIEEAKKLAERIDSEVSLTPTAAQAARLARLELSRQAPKRPAGSAERLLDRANLRDAAVAVAAQELVKGKELYLGAWEQFHPNPDALLGAGLAARTLGESRESQALFDRALSEWREEVHKPVSLNLPINRLKVRGSWAPWIETSWSPDGESLLVLTESIAYVLGSRDLLPRWVLKPKRSWNGGAGWSHDGQLLAMGEDQQLAVIDARSGSELYELSAIVHDTVFSPADDELVIRGPSDTDQTAGQLRTWMITSNQLFRWAEPLSPSGKLAYSSDGIHLAAAETDGSILLYSDHKSRAPQRLLGLHGLVQDIQFSTDGTYVSAVSYSRPSYCRWNVQSGKVQSCMNVGSPATAHEKPRGMMALAEAAHRMARGFAPSDGGGGRGDPLPFVVDTSGGTPQLLSARNETQSNLEFVPLGALALSPDGRRVSGWCAGKRSGARQPEICVWGVGSSETRHALTSVVPLEQFDVFDNDEISIGEPGCWQLNFPQSRVSFDRCSATNVSKQRCGDASDQPCTNREAIFVRSIAENGGRTLQDLYTGKVLAHLVDSTCDVSRVVASPNSEELLTLSHYDFYEEPRATALCAWSRKSGLQLGASAENVFDAHYLASGLGVAAVGEAPRLILSDRRGHSMAYASRLNDLAAVYVVSPKIDQIEFLGEDAVEAQDTVFCQVGQHLAPFAACSERFLNPNLLSEVYADLTSQSK